MTGPARSPFAKALWVVTTLMALGVLAATLYLAPRGLDHTDEGLYLNLLSHPGDYRGTVYLFGYVFHPLYALVGGDIVAMREVNILATWLIGLGLLWTVLGRAGFSGALGRRLGARAHRAERLALATAGATCTLLVFSGLPTTPDYNTFSLQAIMLALLGIVVGLCDGGRRGLLGWVLAGAGAWLTLLAKPTSAAVLAFAVGVLLLTTPRALRRAVPAMAAGLVAAAALSLTLLLRMTPAALVATMRLGARDVNALGGHPLGQMVRWDPFHLEPADALLVLPLLVVGVVFGVLLARSAGGTGSAGRRRGIALPGVAAVAVVASIAVTALVWQRLGARAAAPVAPWGLTTVFLIGWVFVLVGLGGLVVGRPGRALPSWRGVVRIAFVALLPITMAFGTNDNYWSWQALGGVFFAVAGLMYVGLTAEAGHEARPGRRAGPQLSLAVAVALVPAIGVTGVLMADTALQPYRYPSLLTATVPTVVDRQGSVVRLTPQDAARTRGMLTLASSLRIDRSVGMVDLTGDSPGYEYALGARPLGQPWILGGYRGSTAAAIEALRETDCQDLKRAWLLRAPGWRRSIAPAALAAVGVDPVRDYEVVGSFVRVDGVKVLVARPKPGTAGKLTCL